MLPALRLSEQDDQERRTSRQQLQHGEQSRQEIVPEKHVQEKRQRKLLRGAKLILSEMLLRVQRKRLNEHLTHGMRIVFGNLRDQLRVLHA